MGNSEPVDDDRATDPRPVPGWVVATAVAVAVVLGLGAFWLSFTALTDLAERAGIGPFQAWVWPVIVDGIILVATISVVALAPHGKRETRYPWALLAAGTVTSVIANAAHALVVDTNLLGPWAAVISAVPPLVVLAMTHLVVKLASRTDHDQEPRTGQVAEGLPPAQRRRLAWDQHRAGRTNKQIADHLGVHPSTIGRWLAAPRPDSDSPPVVGARRALPGMDNRDDPVTSNGLGAGAHLTGTSTRGHNEPSRARR